MQEFLNGLNKELVIYFFMTVLSILGTFILGYLRMAYREFILLKIDVRSTNYGIGKSAIGNGFEKHKSEEEARLMKRYKFKHKE